MVSQQTHCGKCFTSKVCGSYDAAPSASDSLYVLRLRVLGEIALQMCGR
jgi:hypothetical protein